MKLGFVGLGQMGKPIALNLLKSGAEVVVSDRSDASFGVFRGRGAAGSTDVADLADSDILFLCLPSARIVHDIVLGTGGLASRMKPGQTLVDLSTITHSATQAVAGALEARGIDFLDAPISGMEQRAVEGTLTWAR